MFPKFAAVIDALNDLRTEGLVQEYAVFGAIAQAFWDEAIPTFDLDVLVLPAAAPGALVSLEWLYKWSAERGYVTQDEHIVIGEIPVQIVPAPTPLHEEAVRNAAMLDFDGTPLRVVRPEYLIAMWLQPPADSHSRKERAAKLMESVQIDHAILDDLRQRFDLSW